MARSTYQLHRALRWPEQLHAALLEERCNIQLLETNRKVINSIDILNKALNVGK